MGKLISFGGFCAILALILGIGIGAVVLKGRYNSWALMGGLFACALVAFIVFYQVHLRVRSRWRKKRANGGGVFA